MFNQKAGELDNTVVLCISADLPFVQARFCGAEGLDSVKTLSAFRNDDIAKNLGVAMTSGALAGLTARAVIVLNTDNKVLHSELVPEIKQEPDCDKALASLA
ncbi:MAG: thiol peroxidase [Moraxella equi]|nr:thiol peroxidase [Moraxella equi]